MNTTITMTGSNPPLPRNGPIARMRRTAERVQGAWCVLDARMRTLSEQPEEGAATAEYAVVLVAATGFAALLVTIMKSETVRKLLLDIVKQALSVGG